MGGVEWFGGERSGRAGVELWSVEREREGERGREGEDGMKGGRGTSVCDCVRCEGV